MSTHTLVLAVVIVGGVHATASQLPPRADAILEPVRGSALENTGPAFQTRTICLNRGSYVLAARNVSAGIWDADAAADDFWAGLKVATPGDSWAAFRVEESACYSLGVEPGGEAQIYTILVAIDWSDR